MSRATVLYNRAVYESKRDGTPFNLRPDLVGSLLFEAEKEKGIDVNCAVLRLNDPSMGHMYGNVSVVEQ